MVPHILSAISLIHVLSTLPSQNQLLCTTQPLSLVSKLLLGTHSFARLIRTYSAQYQHIYPFYLLYFYFYYFLNMSFEGALFIDPALQSTTHWSNPSENEFSENSFSSLLYTEIEFGTGSHAHEHSLDNLAPQGPSNTTVEPSSVSPTSSPPSSQSVEDLEPLLSTTGGANRFLCPECDVGYRTKGETR